MHVFDHGIAVESLGGGRYGAALDEEWWVDLGPNGGFLASLILNALTHEVDAPDRHPLTLSVHYPGRATAGEVEIAVEIVRRGRSMTFATARMEQQGQILQTAQASFTVPRTSTGFDNLGRPDVTAAEDIPVLELPDEMVPRFSRKFDYRPALGHFPFTGAPEALVGGWIRPKEARPVDALLLATYADAFFPASFPMATGPFLIPTMDLTVYFRAHTPLEGAGAHDWTLCRFESLHASHGFIEEQGRMWSADGTLLAESRQMAIYGTEKKNVRFDGGRSGE